MGKKIYVVDDDPDMVKVMSFRLKSAGFEITSCRSGGDGLQKIQASPPDLVLLDMQMPDVTGKEIAAAMEKDEKTKNVPIIFLTGKTDLDQSIASGPKRALFIKPCDFDALVKKINAMLG